MPKYTEEDGLPDSGFSVLRAILSWLLTLMIVVYFLYNNQIQMFFTEQFKSENLAFLVNAVLSFLLSGFTGYFWLKERKSGTNSALVFSLAFAVWGVYLIAQAF